MYLTFFLVMIKKFGIGSRTKVEARKIMSNRGNNQCMNFGTVR